ncbi:hypothetical protein FOA52_000205 [Chlamydomonas sp. UWO 241]|nr:hypothetical protein FOA52_000205 [Chlamydomonas sp. UWO 241]
MNMQNKCVYEEINANAIVVGTYNAFHKDNPSAPMPIDVRVEDPNRQVMHHSSNNANGQFVFTTKVAGEYKACFTVQLYQQAIQTKIKIDWKTGVDATNWDAVAKKEHLDAVSLELRKLEESMRAVYDEMLLLQSKESKMRDLSEDTNQRVAWYSVYSLIIIAVSGLWQTWYLRRFWKRKKLL